MAGENRKDIQRVNRGSMLQRAGQFLGIMGLHLSRIARGIKPETEEPSSYYYKRPSKYAYKESRGIPKSLDARRYKKRYNSPDASLTGKSRYPAKPVSVAFTDKPAVNRKKLLRKEAQRERLQARCMVMGLEKLSPFYTRKEMDRAYSRLTREMQQAVLEA